MPKLTLSLFGPFQATVEQQPITDFPTDKIRALLAYLAVEADKPHRRAALATLLWPDYTDAIALRNLRQSLHRLRQTLDSVEATLSADLFTVTRQTIALRSQAVAVDTTLFQTQMATVAAHEHPVLHRCESCLATLRAAVERYRGEFLHGFLLDDGVAFSEWQTLRREQFHHQVVEALQRLVTAHEQRGDYPTMAGFATQLLTLEPWREEAHQWAMRALALDGQRRNALAQYERCRAILAAELGVEPSTATTTLYEEIRRAEGGPPIAARPSTTSSPQQTALLPAQPSPSPITRGSTTVPLLRFPQEYGKFLGRSAEIAQLVAYFTEENCRLVTLIGPGGSGKTRLAIEAARHHLARGASFPDGIVFVTLANVTESALLVSTVAAAVGLHLQEQRAHQTQLIDFLRDKQILLLLDNVEQIIDGAATLAELLDACPTLHLLVTSRAALNLRREQRLAVGGLPYPSVSSVTAGVAGGDVPGVGLEQSAVQLFIQAARQVQPGFTPVGETWGAILEICELVQGMPLALELAAAWVRLTDCATIAREIRTNLDFLATPARDVPARHRSMSAVFAHSWQLITVAERRLLAQLSLFTGGFTLEALLAVTGGTVVDLANLLDWSLIQRTGSQRYGLHELLRQFAAAKLAAWPADSAQPIDQPAPLLTETGQRHSDYFLTFVAELAADLYRAQPQQAMRILRRELDNIRAAWRWAVDAQRFAMLDQAADGFGEFLLLAGLLQEGEQYFAAAVTQTRDMVTEQVTQQVTREAVRSRFLIRQADCLIHQGKLVEAQPLLVEALDCAAAGDPVRLAQAHCALGNLLQIKGAYEAALPHLQIAVRLYRELAHPRGEAQTLNIIGQLYWSQAVYDQALTCHQQALALDRQLENQLGIAQHLSSMGLVYYRQGHYEEARACHQQALAVAEALGNRHSVAKHLNHIGVAYQDQSRFTEATACFEQALAIDRELGNRLGIAARQTNLGLVYMRTGDQARALACTQEAYQLTKAMEHKSGIALTTGNLGVIYWRMGEYAQALALHHEALALDEALGNQEAVGRHLANMGDIYREQGLPAEALRYLERAVAVGRSVNARYQLAETLLRKAEALLALGDLEHTATCQQESFQMAQAIGRADTLFGCRLLAVKLHHARGEPEAAAAQLRTLLQQTESDRERAAVHYEWWRLLGDPFHAEKAATLYRALLRETPNAQYQQRLAVLNAAETTGR